MLWTERSWMGAIYALTLLGTIFPNHRVAATDRAHAHLGVTTRALVAAIVKDAARVLVAVTRVANIARGAVTRVAAHEISADLEAAHVHETRPKVNCSIYKVQFLNPD